VHTALRVDRATEGAGAALAQLPALRAIGPPLTPSAAAPSIASCPLRPIVAGSSGCTRRVSSVLGEVGIEVARPVDAEALRPVVEDLLGGTEAGAGVDHRRAADDPPHRDDDRRAARRDGEAGAAVEGLDRLEAVGRVGVAFVVVAGLEDEYVEAGFGPASPPRPRRPRREPTITTSASLAVAARPGAVSPRGAGGLGDVAAGERAVGSRCRLSASRPPARSCSRGSRTASPSAGGRVLSARREPSRRFRTRSRPGWSRRLKRARERHPLEGAQGRGAAAGGSSAGRSGGTRRSAGDGRCRAPPRGGRRSPAPSPRRSRRACGVQPCRGGGSRRSSKGRSIRPTRTQSQSASRISEPSTRKPSR